MNRKCKFFVGSKNKKKALYLDSINAQRVIDYFKQDKRHLKKLTYVIERLLEHPNIGAELYCKVEINKETVGVKELRLFVGQENDRIYCKEITDKSNNVHIIILGILHEGKASNDLSSKEKNKINIIGGYNYEIE